MSNVCNITWNLSRHIDQQKKTDDKIWPFLRVLYCVGLFIHNHFGETTHSRKKHGEKWKFLIMCQFSQTRCVGFGFKTAENRKNETDGDSVC